MKKLIGISLISFIVFGCQLNTENENLEEKTVEEKVELVAPDEYNIDISTEKINENEIRIAASTNFPDGTNMLISVSRIFYLQGESVRYSGSIYNTDFTVKKGTIETTVMIDDSKWHSERLKLEKQLPDDIKPISQISDDVEISVLFSPKRDQPADIIELVGKYGENLNGEGASTLGKLTTYRASHSIYMPF